MPDWKKLLDTATEQVGEGLKVAGDGMRTAADEARKVAGIGVGTLSIKPARASYPLGGTLTGTARLELTEPVPARALVAVLRATRKGMAVQRRSDGRVAPVQRTETLVDHRVELSGERTYSSGSHTFAVPIPSHVETKVDVGGPLGEVLSAARAVKSMTESPIRWQLEVFLDIPWKRNVSKTIDVSIRD